MKYRYIGDRNTDPGLKLMICHAVKRKDGKCIRGKNGSMLVETANKTQMVVVGRLLRKVLENDN
jgi:hypothetical protein